MGPDGDQRIGLLAVEIALDHPLGIGPMQFYKLFVKDPHSTFLNAFMSGGWLAGFGYLSLCTVTPAMSTRFLLRARRGSRSITSSTPLISASSRRASSSTSITGGTTSSFWAYCGG